RLPGHANVSDSRHSEFERIGLMAERFGPLVSADWLREHLGEPNLRVVDLRWYLDGRSGRDAFEAGHLPGAVFVDLDRDLAAPAGDGRHPLPAREQFQEAMRAAGVDAAARGGGLRRPGRVQRRAALVAAALLRPSCPRCPRRRLPGPGRTAPG